MAVSIWEKETFFAPQDVIIIGSGFVGLWSALSLKKRWPGARITILERGALPSGASTRNAGFACFGSLSELVQDAQQMGTENMLSLVEMRYKGLERIQRYFGNKVIDFERCGGYELYEPGAISAATLQENIAYLNTLLKPITSRKKTYRLANEKITRFGFGHTAQLVENRLEGYLHPGKLLQLLLQRVHSEGIAVLNGIEITHLHPENNGVSLQSATGACFSAGRVLLCTNAFTRQLLPAADIVPGRGQVLLTSPIRSLPFSGTFHSDEGFYYFRNLNNRVLLGGARNKAFEAETSTVPETTQTIQQALENYLAEVILPQFRNQYTIDHRWAGIMAFGREKRPLVQQVAPNVFCAVRMSGMGVALAPIVARQVAGMMGEGK